MIIKKKKLKEVLGNVPEELQSEESIADGFDVPKNTDDDFEGDLVSQNDIPPENSLSPPENPVQDTAFSGSAEVTSELTPEPDEIDLFSLDNIDFKQRQERRKGDRRRGFRRVDDRNLISRAREEADAIREAASKEGYQTGLEQASADLQEVRNAIGVFLNAKQEIFNIIAPSILEISVDIAEKIIKKEVQEDPQVLINTVIDVLKELSKEENKVLLRVNPAQVDVVKQQVPEILNMAGLDAKVSVLADEEVMEGGCLVTTSNGVVDATIETQFAVVCEALREV